MTTIRTPHNPDHEWRFWLAIAVALGLALWLLSPVITPFLLAMMIAYFLDPAVRRMSGLGVPRGLSAALALFIFIAVVTAAIIVIGPIVREQATDLVKALPGYIETLQNNVWPRFSATLAKYIPALDPSMLKANLTQYSGDAVNLAGLVVGRVLVGGWALLNVIGLFILTPVITFYLLRDWPVIVSRVDSVLPQRYAPSIRQEMHAIDNMIAGFIRGQATVSLVLAAFYSTGLYLVGLKYGMLVGLITGLLSFIPVVGTILGAVLSLTLAFIQFDTAASVLKVVGVFVAAQVLDGYLLTPYLVGTKVGLHPVAIIFAVIAGGALFGFLGVILAVPVAGTIAILLRSAVRRYRNSPYYLPPAGQ